MVYTVFFTMHQHSTMVVCVVKLKDGASYKNVDEIEGRGGEQFKEIWMDEVGEEMNKEVKRKNLGG